MKSILSYLGMLRTLPGDTTVECLVQVHVVPLRFGLAELDPQCPAFLSSSLFTPVTLAQA